MNNDVINNNLLTKNIIFILNINYKIYLLGILSTV